jgi:hypothetical protein
MFGMCDRVGFMFPGGNRGGIITLTFLINITTVELHVFQVFLDFITEAGTEKNKN